MGVEQSAGLEGNRSCGSVVWLTSLQANPGRCDLSAYPDLEQALVSPGAIFSVGRRKIRPRGGVNLGHLSFTKPAEAVFETIFRATTYTDAATERRR